jgi:hypothetical protein
MHIPFFEVRYILISIYRIPVKVNDLMAYGNGAYFNTQLSDLMYRAELATVPRDNNRNLY